MRLSDSEKKYIKDIFLKYSDNESAIYLFGSRTNDTKKGGDIDLLITFKEKEQLLRFKRLDYVIDLKNKIGERKIDLTLATLEDLSTDPFLKSTIENAIEL